MDAHFDDGTYITGLSWNEYVTLVENAIGRPISNQEKMMLFLDIMASMPRPDRFHRNMTNVAKAALK